MVKLKSSTWKRQLDAGLDGLHDVEVGGGCVEQPGSVNNQNFSVWKFQKNPSVLAKIL